MKTEKVCVILILWYRVINWFNIIMQLLVQVTLHHCYKCIKQMMPINVATSELLVAASYLLCVLALDLEGVHDVKLHHPSSYVATSNQ